MANKYDIRVCDIDANGQKKWHEESGIMAGSAQELMNIYKMCGQEIQILHEYQDDEAKNYGHQKMLKAEDVQMSSGLGATGLMKVSEEDQKKIEEFEKNESIPVKPQTSSPRYLEGQKVSEPPKFFTISGIKCKMENGKFYQKQWVRLSDEETSEIRIVSDKNNKITTLKDKHIEVLKWVITEDSDSVVEKPVESEKELING